MKIQAGIQVSRPGELKRQLQLWKRFGRLYSIVFVLVRNILCRLDMSTWENVHVCCNGCRVVLRAPPEYPEYIKQLYNDSHFMENIRAYNQMFSMTSVGANIDSSINNGRGPYVFRISGQIYHWIGSMCPDEGNEPRHNALVQLFRTAQNKYMESDIPEFKVKLYNVIRTRRYELPSAETIGVIVFGGASSIETEFDLIVEEYSCIPHRVNKLHPCYMSLQFPLLGYYTYDKGSHNE
ncbi:hypothetical protein Tco_0855943 [Tanacetum coccineum]